MAGVPADFARMLRLLRGQAGWTQEDLAFRAARDPAAGAGVSVSRISELERGIHPRCQKGTAERLAAAFGLADPARDAFVAVARGQRPAPAVLTAGIWETLCGYARRRGQPAPPGSSQPLPQVRYSLPADAAAFTGRRGELARITAAVKDAATGGGVVAVGAIGGMPGVGKTALAVHVAHVLAGEFPDRQLFIDLHGYTPGQEPVRPEDALAGLLAATGVDLRYLPGDLGGRAGLWRDRMAGQRAVLVLDNAAGSGQVAPLLPGGGGCVVLVTSRRHLGDLPGAVTPVLVDVLPPGEAAEMFVRLAPRAAGDRAGVAEVVKLAGFLPLGVSLLARVFAGHPSWALADLAAETRVGAGVLMMAAENDSVAAAFELSYRHLGPEAQRLFRLLGVHPGGVADSYAAAALTGIPRGEAAGLLDVLHREGLLTEAGYRRYGMHDLLRRYADDLAADAPAASQAALGRLLDYYQHTAALAGRQLAWQTRPGPAPAAPAGCEIPVLGDAGQALAWARAERASLLACLDLAARTGQHIRVVVLTAGLAAVLRRDGPWAEAVTRHAAAVAAARHLGDRFGEASALIDFGEMRCLTGDHQGAAEVLKQALGICRDLRDRSGEAAALSNLGIVRQEADDFQGAARIFEQALGIYRDLGDRFGEGSTLIRLGHVRRVTDDFPGAVQIAEQALDVCRDIGDQPGEANALFFLGLAAQVTGDYLAAVQMLEQALAISRILGDQPGEANALGVLGIVRHMTGDYPGAAQMLEHALGISRNLGDRFGEANVLLWLGIARQVTGDYPAAVQAQEQALGISRDLGDRFGEAAALCNLGRIQHTTGDFPAAARVLEEALGIYRSLGSQLGEAYILSNLGTVRRLTGDHAGAARALEKALDAFRRVGDRQSQAEVLNEQGTLNQACGDLAQARQRHQQALDLARAIGSPRDQAHALAGLSRCVTATGHTAEAEVLLRQAHEILQRIGAAEAPGVLAELDALTRAGSA